MNTLGILSPYELVAGGGNARVHFGWQLRIRGIRQARYPLLSFVIGGRTDDAQKIIFVSGRIVEPHAYLVHEEYHDRHLVWGIVDGSRHGTAVDDRLGVYRLGFF